MDSRSLSERHGRDSSLRPVSFRVGYETTVKLESWRVSLVDFLLETLTAVDADDVAAGSVISA